MVAMPIPEFITDLRSHVGHAPLWLSGVSGVVRDDHGRILLTHRADTAEWAVVSGVLEPGEELRVPSFARSPRRPPSTPRWYG